MRNGVVEERGAESLAFEDEEVAIADRFSPEPG
jgi:hypothetical protein